MGYFVHICVRLVKIEDYGKEHCSVNSPSHMPSFHSFISFLVPPSLSCFVILLPFILYHTWFYSTQASLLLSECIECFLLILSMVSLTHLPPPTTNTHKNTIKIQWQLKGKVLRLSFMKSPRSMTLKAHTHSFFFLPLPSSLFLVWL